MKSIPTKATTCEIGGAIDFMIPLRSGGGRRLADDVGSRSVQSRQPEGYAISSAPVYRRGQEKS